MLAFALFCLWILFNGKWTWEVAAFGAVIALALSWFVRRFIATGMNLRRQVSMARRAPDILRYLLLLIKEIAKANIAVIRLILSDRDVVVPTLSSFKASLDSDIARIILADSITLTPGTITVNLRENEYLVHCLDESMASGLPDSEFERQLRILEGKPAGEIKP